MELTKVKLKTTISEAFRRAKFELLPEEISNDALARWVTDFDQLSKTETYDRNWDRPEGRDETVIELILAPMIRGALTPKMSFYFASLFHIGRGWQVARYASDTAKDALQPQHLERTTDLYLERFQNDLLRLEVPPGERRTLLSRSLSDVLSLTADQHLEAIQKSKKLWQVWKDEVGELRSATEELSGRVEDYKNLARREPWTDYHPSNRAFFRSVYRLIFFSVEQGRLFHLLTQDGVHFKALNDPPQVSVGLAQLMQFALTRGDEGALVEGIRDCLRMYHDVLSHQAAVTKEQRLAPVVQEVEAQLFKLFASGNPFEKYRALQSPPDEELSSLWSRCKLPNGEMFYFARNWLDSLRAEPSFYSDGLPYAASLSDDDIIAYAFSADATIRRNWVNTSLRTFRSDRDAIQKLLEKWIEVLSRGALYPTTKEKGTQRWKVDSFHDLISKVVIHLNLHGYSLVPPSVDRIKVLWEEVARKDRSYWSTIEW
jgi:hypothetical protein